MGWPLGRELKCTGWDTRVAYHWLHLVLAKPIGVHDPGTKDLPCFFIGREAVDIRVCVSEEMEGKGDAT